MDIVECKSRLESLTSEILCKYVELEKQNTLLKKNNIQELESINHQQSSMCELIKEKESRIYSLENEIKGLHSRESEYINTIDNLKEQLNHKSEEQENVSKFDMIRSQAKEISAKDKEIIRLTKELAKVKELNKMKENIKLDVKDNTITGWSPTTSVDPSPEVSQLKLDEPDREPGPVSDPEADPGPDPVEESDEEEELYIVKYRKKSYYRDSDNNVFIILENEDKGERVGSWVKQTNGKSKLVKN